MHSILRYEHIDVPPRNSPLRNALDVAILNAVHSAWWEQTIFRYLGSR
jgi:hypothetical protein